MIYMLNNIIQQVDTRSYTNQGNEREKTSRQKLDEEYSEQHKTKQSKYAQHQDQVFVQAEHP